MPKAGGNEFSYNLFMKGTQDWLSSDNQSQELKDQGFEFAPQDFQWELNPAMGGPIVEDQLWFFASFLELRKKLDTAFHWHEVRG